jgi:hypothetical protein
MSGSESQVKRSSQGQIILYHGMKLSTMPKLFRLKPTLRWKRWVRLGLLPLFGTYNSFWAGIETLLYSRKIARTEISHPPIFVLGYWRSGTTLLHNLMTLDRQFTYPTLYETVFPWHFLTTETINTSLTGWMVPDTRPMDNVPVSWSVPQEDDFALCTMCMVSPYTLPLRPFDQKEWTRSFHIDELPPQDRKLWEETILLFMKKLTVRNNKPIVMKSPAHTYRVKALLRLFPNAKFVHITRNPYDVFRSALHLRATMIEENTLGDAYHPDAEESVIETYMDMYRTYEQEKLLVPAGNLAEVKYEDLSRDPVTQMQQIYEKLQLSGWEDVRSRIESQLSEHKEYKKNKFKADPVWRQQVYERCKEIYDRFGYPSPEEEETAAA